MVEANALLHEALTLIDRIARLDADCRSRPDEVGKFRAVEYWLHAARGQESGVESPRSAEVTHGQDDMCHAVDANHWFASLLGVHSYFGQNNPTVRALKAEENLVARDGRIGTHRSLTFRPRRVVADRN
jgi:hypothetical protein